MARIDFAGAFAVSVLWQTLSTYESFPISPDIGFFRRMLAPIGQNARWFDHSPKHYSECISAVRKARNVEVLTRYQVMPRHVGVMK